MTTITKNEHFWSYQPDLDPHGYAYCDRCGKVKNPEGKLMTYKQALKEIDEKKENKEGTK